MKLDKLREELAADEGCKFEIYLDHLGLPTFGIGALIKDGDPECGQPVGTPVDEERVRQRFNLDIAVTIEDCQRLFRNWDDLPEEAQLVCANMAFNLGYPRFSKFVNFRAAIEAQDWLKGMTVSRARSPGRIGDRIKVCSTTVGAPARCRPLGTTRTSTKCR